ncbi:LysM peptidoglycan-binding domain-containing protein [Pararhodospirillum photometricum]|uniref:LysM domain-containing protein n=1 Tax=Pararhodospirillum photometricum DSM 122 TaxID=1150469 RepID=H6SR19_PARPM|nr:LysM domain-containing protein [Pararhodospirillum photometricum]CCG09741.1 Putative uncharacterized protein [Pararhodospirillum photometricum DSM 122]
MRTGTAVLVLAVALLAAGLGGGALWSYTALTQREIRLAELSLEVTRLRAALALLEEERQSLEDRLGPLELERDAAREALAQQRKIMEETMVPREIGGHADFPIHRGMAQAGDTLASFAAREETSVSVLKALNPWVDESKPFAAYQTLWLPRRP